MRALFLCAAALTITVTAPGQNPMFYFGKPATGEFSLYRSVNLRQLGAAKALLRAAQTEAAFSPEVQIQPTLNGPEMLPKIEPRLHPPVQGSRPVGATGHLGGVSSARTGVFAARAALAQSAGVPTQTLNVVKSPASIGFDGLSHADQRLASNGNQLSVEPPNTSIAVGNGYILEGVNNAVMVYDLTGKPALPKVYATNEVFGLAPAIIRSPLTFGPFPTDMRVFYDAGINRFFILQRVHDRDTFGNDLNLSHMYLAVSQTGDPTASYNVYVADTTDVSNPLCPCLADYPQIGADQYGFYISVDEYDTQVQSFVGAVIYAISKSSLASGAATPTAYKFPLPFLSGYEFAVQPATTPPGASYFIASGGIEYFASTVGSFSSGNSVSIWAMTNTSSLSTGSPAPQLMRISVPTLTYVWPDFATQPEGSRPNGQSLTPPGALPFIDPGDTRALSLMYSAGELFLTFSTKVTDINGKTLAGGAFIEFFPAYRNGTLTASVSRQSYLAVTDHHLLFPVIGVNPRRNGAIAVTLTGPNFYPSAAFVPIDPVNMPSTLRVPAPGLNPEDGFTGYPGGSFPGLARWGDYNAAAVAADGSVWIGAEYIGNAPRTEAANWQTFIARAIP